MTLVSEVSSRPPNRRAVLAAAAVMATGGWAQQALAAPERKRVTLNSVLPFDTSTWQRLVDKGPRPAAYIFTTTYCPSCPEAFDRLFAHIQATRKMAELVVVLMDVRILDRTIPAEVTLTRRDAMGFRMLVGRELLRKGFLVDAHKSYLGGKPPKAVRRANRVADEPQGDTV